MKTNPILIPCFVLAIGACGCQVQDSSNSGMDSSVGATQADEESKLTDRAASAKQNPSTVIAYYFHRTMRCHTCLAIETNAARVIENNFSKQITTGQLIWMPYNLEDPGGADLAKEFTISASTLVLAKMQDGNPAKYKKLEKVWDFIGDPAKFDTYVQTEVNQFLNE